MTEGDSAQPQESQGIMDWFDSKGIPRLAVYAITLLIALLVVFFVILPLAMPAMSEVKIIVKDDKGQLVSGQKVDLSFEGKSTTAKTNVSGALPAFSVKLNEKITILVEREGFSRYSATIIADKQSKQFVVELKKPIPLVPTKINLMIADSAGATITSKEVTVRLKCLNPAISIQPDVLTTSIGSVSIEVPDNCGAVIADISAAGFQNLANVSITESEKIIKLSAIEVPKGKVIVKIQDSEANLLKDVSFTVVLADTEGEVARQETITGVAEFPNVEKKEYYATVTDSSARYETKTTESKSLVGEYISIIAVMKRQTKGFVSLRVIDAVTSERVANASVKILDSGGRIIASVITDRNSDKNLALFDKGTYTLQVSHDDFVAFEQKIEFNNASISITASLEKCSESAQNCGKLEVLVLDEDNLVVENAMVSVYNAETSLLAPLLPKVTDVNGIAKFSNLKKGKYFLRAVKYPAERKDSGNVFEIDPKIPAKKTIRMEIGNGVLKVVVKDEEGQAIPNARVEFRTDSGKECPKANGEACVLETSTENGSVEYSFKADKKVYAIVSKEEYSSFVSSYYQIWKGQAGTITAVLRTSIPGDKPELSIVGVYGLDGTTRKNELKAGQRYIIRLKLDFPQSLAPKTAGFFIMAGSSEKGSIVENEPIYLRGVAAPEITVIKGTTWNPDNGSDIDLDPNNLTNDDFKWAQAVFSNARANTTYLIDAETKVRENVTSGQALLFYYRAWAELDSGEIVREPFDERLGTALESSSVQSLYALAKEQPFYEGKPALCEDESGFCYYNERVYDESDRLNIPEPYDLKVFQTYTVTLEISNISFKSYGTENNEARFRLKNTDNQGATLSNVLQIIDYNFINANNQQISQAGLNAFEIPEIQVKELRQNKSVKMTMRLQAKKAESSTILVQIIAGSEIVFSREISFSVNAENQLSLSISPDFFGAFVTNDFNATVKDNQGIEAENATVKVTKITPDRYETTIGNKKTNRLGVAGFRIASSSPGTTIRIEAEKEGYAGAMVEKKIDENVLSFDPEELEARLDLKSHRSRELTTNAQSKVPISLTVSNARVSGNFGGYLDEDAMNNFIGQFVGNLNFEPNDSRILTVKAAVSPSAMLEEEVNVKGFVHLEVSNSELQKTWAFNIPLKAEIGVGGSVDDTGCLNISLKEWKTMTQENLTSKEFTILNNCRVEGSDIPVQYLKARLKWKSNPIGNVQVSIVDPETGSSASEILRDGDWITLFDTLRPSEEAEYYSIISFAPSQGHLNEEAKFEVEFDAFTPTDSGLKSVEASNSIKAEILVTTLLQCVEFEPGSDAGARIEKGEDEASFTISTEKCGSIPIQFRFCQDDAKNTNCRGGTSDGGIEVTPWTTSSMTEATKEITVRRQSIDGYYGITVEAKVPGRGWMKIIDYPVIIEPKESKYFYLDKYSFVLLGNGSKDSTDLYNTMLEEPVEVKANLCSWGEAAKNKNFAGNAAMAAGVGLVVAYVLYLVVPAAMLSGVSGLAWLGIISWCPVCAVIGLLAALIMTLVMGGGGDSCQDQTLTETLQDFVVNLSGTMDKDYERYLPPDAQEIIFSDDRIKPSWSLDVRDVEKGVQKAGIVLENLGIEQPEPLYGILTTNSKDHIHGDVSHSGNAKVECESGDFGNYWINPGACDGASDTTYSQRFHIMVKTQETRQLLPQIKFDTYDCSTSTLLGRTGKGALPQVKLNWTWTPSTGIDYDSCDAENPNGVYCDATQFSIALNKRIYLLDEFFRANNYFENVCPEDTANQQTQNATTAEGTSLNSRQIDTNSIHIKSIIKQQTAYNSTTASDEITVITTIKNGSLAAGSTQLSTQVTFMDGTSANASCAYQEITIQPFAETTQECHLALLQPGGYIASASLASGTGNTVKVDTTQLYLSFYVLEKTQAENDFIQSTGCQIARTTDLAAGKSILLAFIKAAGGFNNGVNPTTAVPDENSLIKLFSFDALLMRDAFTMDFRKDFVNYYTTQSLADADQFFKDDAQGFKKYFLDENRLKFKNKYFDSDRVWAPGRYKVNIAALYTDDWRLFDASGNPKAGAVVSFYLLKEPNPNSPFYSTPFDGLVGLEGDSFNRQGYGTQFMNQDDIILVDNSPTPAKTAPDAGSNAVNLLKTRVENNLKNLNNDLTRRGNLLMLETQSSSEKQMEFSSNLATPVMMKVTASEKTDNPFAAFYSMLQGNSPAIVGDSLALWSAGGNCYDFSGLPLIQVFDEKPDRKATAIDNLADWQTAYAVDWPNIEMTGSNYLRSVFYTPKNQQHSLHAVQPSNALSFYTPDNEGQNIALNGISGMQKNTLTSSINTIEDIFTLVKNQKVCVTNTGVRTRFWWNPKAINEQTGSKRSIGGMSNNLKAGTDCIG